MPERNAPSKKVATKKPAKETPSRATAAKTSAAKTSAAKKPVATTTATRTPATRRTAVAKAAVGPKPGAAKRGAKRAAVATAEAGPLHAPFFDAAGARQGEFDLPESIFAETPNMPVMHQAYLRQLANGRQGTASTKTRAMVSGGGAKPYRQKGTGRARHGSTREPSMKGGGNVFGPRPRSYAQRMPRQMRRLALRSALSQKALDSQVSVIEAFAFEEPKTRQAAELIGAIGFDSSTLVVLPAPNYVVSRSFENLSDTKIILAHNLNIHDLFSHKFLLLAKESIQMIEDSFGPRRKESA